MAIIKNTPTIVGGGSGGGSQYKLVKKAVKCDVTFNNGDFILTPQTNDLFTNLYNYLCGNNALVGYYCAPAGMWMLNITNGGGVVYGLLPICPFGQFVKDSPLHINFASNEDYNDTSNQWTSIHAYDAQIPYMQNYIKINAGKLVWRIDSTSTKSTSTKSTSTSSTSTSSVVKAPAAPVLPSIVRNEKGFATSTTSLSAYLTFLAIEAVQN